MRTLALVIDDLKCESPGVWLVNLNGRVYRVSETVFSSALRAYLEKFVKRLRVFCGLAVEATFDGENLVRLSLPSSSLALLARYNPEIIAGRYGVDEVVSEFARTDTAPSYYQPPPPLGEHPTHRVVMGRVDWSPLHDAFNTYDGDTFYVQGLGKVRLWGVEAPEIPRWTGSSFEGEEQPGGYMARDYLRDLVAGKDVVLEIDKSIQFPGYQPGQDPYGRWLVVAYVRDSAGNWVNVNKALLAQDLARVDIQSQPSYFSRHDFYRLGARPLPFLKGQGWHDPDWTVAEDDRDRVLGPIYLPDGSLDPHIMRLGDVQFRVPPESIRVTRRTAGVKVPLIRARTSAFKETGHAETMVEITLYFTSEEEINGRPYHTTLPNGRKVTYYVNGLRALLAQFKKCPFLPVQNHYLNNIHGIDALTLANLECSTLPGFPGVLVVNLTCYVFDYTAYLPTTLDFNAVFNWPLFRYYYQRSLSEKAGGLYFAPFDGTSSDFTFKIISEEELARRKAAEKRLYSQKYAPSGVRIIESMRTKAKGRSLALNEQAVLDLYYLEEALREWREVVVPLKKKYADTGDERFNPKYKYASGAGALKYYKVIGGEEWLEIGLNNIKTINEVRRNYPSRIIEHFAVYTEAGTADIPVCLLRFKAPGMKGISRADTVIQSLIKRQAFIDPKSKKESAYLKSLWEEEYTEYYRALEIYQSEFDIEEAMEDFPIESLYLVRATASMQNIIVPLQVQMAESPAHQYFGGQDVVVRLEFETGDESAIQALQELVRRAAYLAREYRRQIFTGLLGFDSSLTRLAGVSGVVVNDMYSEVDSPGHYRVAVILSAYNYNQRRMFLPQKIGEANFFTKADPNWREQVQFDYMNLRSVLSTVELYPDLELPTYEELHAAGFVKSIEGKPVYPDPDFYITVHTESVGDMVGAALNQPLAGQVQDQYGGKARVSTAVGGRPGGVEYNEKSAEMIERSRAALQEGFVDPQEAYASALVRDVPGKRLFEGGQVYKSNPPAAEIQSKLVRLAEHYGVPHYALLGLVHTENSSLMHFYSTDPRRNAWLGDVGSVSRSDIPIMTTIDGGRVRHLTEPSMSNLRRSTGVGLMQINCTYRNDAEIRKIAWDIDYNLETGVRIYLDRYNEVVRQGMVLPSEVRGRSADAEEARWLAAALRYKGWRLNQFSSAGARKDLSRLVSAFELYKSFGTGGFRFPVSIPEEGYHDEEFQEYLEEKEAAKRGALVPDENGDFFARSFEDMRRYDRRGRLVRAFPTFFLLLVDEGRYINTYKLHDNFYSYHAINDISVHRSRKIAADTCVIKLSNVFGGLDTLPPVPERPPEDNPLAAALSALKTLLQAPVRELEQQRSQVFERLYLQPGARIHLRIGYGADVNDLPILFNGVVTELSAGEVMEVVAQGDGIELTNNLPWGPHEGPSVLGIPGGKAFGIAREPRELLYTLLTYRGGWLKNVLNRWLRRHEWTDRSPLGIAHFGDPGMSALFFWNNPEDCNAEIMQNIYSAVSVPVKEDSDLGFIARLFGKPDEDQFEINLFDKTVWDVLQILAAATPDFIAAVHPFQFRSTIFFGKPYWDMVYDYKTIARVPGQGQDSKALIQVEPLKKPFRQFHIYYSGCDILSNQIEASARDVHTCVIGVYTANTGQGADTPKLTPPIFADDDIYPEVQRTVHVFTENYFGGIRFLQNVPLVGLIPRAVNWVRQFMGQGREQAIRIATSALRDYVKDMYQGALVVMGDPSVKPYDVFYLLDFYEDMSGVAEVKSVTHHLGFDTGFVTSITPDASVAISDTLMVQQWVWLNNVTAFVALRLLSMRLARAFKYGGSTPVLASLLAAAQKGRDKFLAMLRDERVRKVLVRTRGIGIVQQLERLAASDHFGFFSAVRNVLTRGRGALAGAGAVVTGGAAVAGGLPLLAAVLAEFVVVGIISQAVGNAFKNFLLTRQAVKICVLRKHGREFSAGINGHNGCVYGDSGDLLTRLIRDNKFVRFFLQWGVGVDGLENMVAYQPFDEERSADTYFRKLNDALEDAGEQLYGLPEHTTEVTGGSGRARPDMGAFYDKHKLTPEAAKLNLMRIFPTPVTSISSGVSYTYLRPEAWKAIQDVGYTVSLRFNAPLVITSAYRPSSFINRTQHSTGFAIDIDIPKKYEKYSDWHMMSKEGREWLSFVVEQLVRRGFVEIIINDIDIVNEMKRRYPRADVRFCLWRRHRDHIHCVYVP
ncbi:MAG: thermonuclease family protein [Bacillota bacterium]